jgi:uncharacterized protein YcgI (DUF1989 family)
VKSLTRPGWGRCELLINPDSTITLKPPDTKPGDNIVLRAEMDAYIVVSACPQDIIAAVCGGNPTDIQVEVGHGESLE